jgi:hypothetical protein
VNKQSSGALGIAILLGGSSLAFSCLSDPNPPEAGIGGAGVGGAGEASEGNAGGLA